MRHRVLLIVTLAALLPLGGTAVPVAQAASGSAIPDQYIVVFKNSVTDPSVVADELSQKHGLTTKEKYRRALKGFAAIIPSAKLSAIKADPRILFVTQERSFQVPKLHPPSQPPQVDFSLLTGIRRIGADLSSTRAGDRRGAVDVDIAILDTGINRNHPDLNVAGGYNCSSDKRNDWEDDDGHGTHVAGTAAAFDNDIGVVGVAPGARVWALKVFDDNGTGSTSTVLCAIDWVTANAGTVEVANMSLGDDSASGDDGNCGRTSQDPFHLAICGAVAAGVTQVASAGNETTNLAKQIPAAYREVLTATAIVDHDGLPGGTAPNRYCVNAPDDSPAPFSNFTTVGSPDISHVVAAPGSCILSTFIGLNYAYINGTSMASPHVAGTVALCIGNGACARAGATAPKQIVADATARSTDRTVSPYYGFSGDPNSPLRADRVRRYYGYLVWAGGY